MVEKDEGNFLLQKHQEAEGKLFREAEQVRKEDRNLQCAIRISM